MKILILSKYTAAGPSSRYRFYQFLPALEQAGVQFTVLPLFTDAYIQALFSGKKQNPLYLINRFVSRLGHCLAGGKYDLAWIEGELIPYLPAGLERLLHGLLPPRVYEFDDANWLRYENKPVLNQKFAKILASAAGIVVGNRFLENYVRPFNSNTFIVPTVVRWEKYRDAAPALKGSIIGWVGSRSTVSYLDDITPALQTLAKTHDFTLRVVGADFEAQGFRVENEAWAGDREVAQIEALDIGIMPLTATPWSEGKCGLKLIQYLAAGLPAVAAPVGVNTEILEKSGGGFAAADQAAWVTHLKTLLENLDTRRAMGAAGRAWVQAQTTVDAQAPRLIRFLQESSTLG